MSCYLERETNIDHFKTPQAYKIVSIVGGRPYAGSGGLRGRKVTRYSELKILCYYIDFSGYRFDSISDTFTFRPFDNEMSITDLEAYPLAYASFGDAKGENSMLKFLESRGKSFIEVTEASHKLYEGVAYSATKEEVGWSLLRSHIYTMYAYYNWPSTDYSQDKYTCDHRFHSRISEHTKFEANFQLSSYGLF